MVMGQLKYTGWLKAYVIANKICCVCLQRVSLCLAPHPLAGLILLCRCPWCWKFHHTFSAGFFWNLGCNSCPALAALQKQCIQFVSTQSVPALGSPSQNGRKPIIQEVFSFFFFSFFRKKLQVLSMFWMAVKTNAFYVLSHSVDLIGGWSFTRSDIFCCKSIKQTFSCNESVAWTLQQWRKKTWYFLLCILITSYGAETLKCKNM